MAVENLKTPEQKAKIKEEKKHKGKTWQQMSGTDKDELLKLLCEKFGMI